MPLAKNTVIVAQNGQGFRLFEDFNLVPRNRPEFSNWSTTFRSVRISPNNKYMVISTNYGTYLFDVSGDDWVSISTPVSTVANYNFLEFSADNSRLIMGKSGNVSVLDLASNTLVFSETSTSTVYGCCLSRDGSKIAICCTTAPRFRVFEITAGGVGTAVVTSLPAPSATLSYNVIKAMTFNLDGSEYGIVSTYFGAEFFNTSTGALSWSLSHTGLGNASTNDRYSCQGELNDAGIFVVGMNYCRLGFIDVVNQSGVGVPLNNAHSSSLTANWVQWSGDTAYIGNPSYFPAIQSVHYPTLSLNDDLFNFVGVSAFAVSYPSTAYKVTGNIVESLEVAIWRCAAYNLNDFKLIGYVDVPGPTFEIFVPDATPVMVLVSPVPAVRWKASTNYVIGTEVFPTNTVSTPFYYRCVGAGVSSATEPTWGTVAGGQTNDGTAVWELIEGLVQPVAHMPLSPVPV